MQAKNVYGHLGKEDVYRFRVLPPWPQTWWAFSLYALLLSLLVFLSIKWRVRALKKEKKKLEEIVDTSTKELKEKNLKLEVQTHRLKEQSEELKEMNKIKSRFFANISHEFRTPLTLIIGPLEQMVRLSSDKTQERELKTMLRNSQRLLGLINQLLNLSKFDSGKMQLHTCRQNIIPFLKGVVDAFNLNCLQKQIHLEFLHENQDITLYFDPEKMEVISTNLIINAIKFTPVGGKITILVKTIISEEEPSQPGFLELSVCDTGIGIPKKQLPHIFERFFQADIPGSPEHTVNGTGIGLALTKDLVTLHHGRLDVSSTEGEGSEFVILLPMGKEHLKPGEIVNRPNVRFNFRLPQHSSALYTIKSEEDDTMITDGGETGTSAAGGNKNAHNGIDNENQEKNVILVVEDNAEVRQFISKNLEPFYT
ncbi:MAG: HAMP domain-containing histidine kinase, partial [bacterium]|nr:HAMP domain-containing histidine kinase [bacterium]